MKTQRGLGLCALGILAAIAAVSCLGPTGIEVRAIIQTGKEDVDIWKGEAAGHDDALATYGPPQKNWVYRNTTDQYLYKYDGEKWVQGGGGASVRSTIRITGDYIPPVDGYFPVRVYFTDGSNAEGYIEDLSGEVRLYDGRWNDQSEGKKYHTLKLLIENESILLSREIDVADWVELNIDADAKLQFRDINNPIPIDTVGELALIGRDGTTLGGTYELKRDLDLLGTVGNNMTGLPPYNWRPLGGMTTVSYLSDCDETWYLPLGGEKFTGTFDGGGWEISNLWIDRGTRNPSVKLRETESAVAGIGLFGHVENAVLKNIHITSGSVQGDAYVAGIAGIAKNSEISDCSNAATVMANGFAGGIAGGFQGEITGCDNTASVTSGGGSGAGGIAGLVVCLSYYGNIGSVITDCDNYGAVSGATAGGIVGDNRFGAITLCNNYGPVQANGDSVFDEFGAGGIAGAVSWNEYDTDEGSGIAAFAITECKNKAPVTARSYAGGIAGRSGTVIRCDNTGAVTAEYDYAGGIAGRAYNPYEYIAIAITGCGNTGAVTTGGFYAGGIAGYSGGNNAIAGCANTGLVEAGYTNGGSGGEYAGGIVGLINDGGTITACINTGEVKANGKKLISMYLKVTYTGGQYAGGIAGGVYGYDTSSHVRACFNTGRVMVRIEGYPGGITGMLQAYDNGFCTSIASYWLRHPVMDDPYRSYDNAVVGYPATCAWGPEILEGGNEGPGVRGGEPWEMSRATPLSGSEWPEFLGDWANYTYSPGEEAQGKCWASPGSWNSGDPILPKLYWQL